MWRDMPLEGARANDFERLNAVRHAPLACHILVEPRRNALPALFHRPVRKDEGGDAVPLQPTRDAFAFQTERQRNARAARRDDNTRARRFFRIGKIYRQRRRHHVERNGAQRCIANDRFALRPILRTGRRSVPDGYYYHKSPPSIVNPSRSSSHATALSFHSPFARMNCIVLTPRASNGSPRRMPDLRYTLKRCAT